MAVRDAHKFYENCMRRAIEETKYDGLEREAPQLTMMRHITDGEEEVEEHTERGLLQAASTVDERPAAASIFGIHRSFDTQ